MSSNNSYIPNRADPDDDITDKTIIEFLQELSLEVDNNISKNRTEKLQRTQTILRENIALNKKAIEEKITDPKRKELIEQAVYLMKLISNKITDFKDFDSKGRYGGKRGRRTHRRTSRRRRRTRKQRKTVK